MYNSNLYGYNPQANLDRINNQMNELEKMKHQIQQSMQQPTNLTQNFQITPTNREVMRYADSLNEVERDMVIGDTPYFSRDMSVVWIKNTKGVIKTYELTEIVPLDEKDIQIKYLQDQIEELKKARVRDEQYITNDNEPSPSEDDGPVGTTTKKSKSSSVPTVSKREKE